MGNAGRWFWAIAMIIGYAYSMSAVGLVFAKKFINGNYQSAKTYFLFGNLVLVLSYAIFSIISDLTEKEKLCLYIGDFLSIIPHFAFQRGFRGILISSETYNDPELSLKEVLSWEYRVWFSCLMMYLVGSLCWCYLHKLTTVRPAPLKLKTEEQSSAHPVDVINKPDLLEEKERSLLDDEGINIRDIVKLFRSPQSDDSKSKKLILKHANKGISYGIRKNEIYGLLGPNGAGSK